MRVARILIAALVLTAALFCAASNAAIVDPYSFEPPVPKGYDMPYTLTVYLSRQMVVAYDAATGEPVRYMICSSGLMNPTPRLNVTTPGTVIQPWAKWGSVYVRYPTRIKGSYYFHSITYNSKNSVNAEAWRKLGSRASHGCVRLTPLDAQWIAYNCKKGTRVRIVSNDDSGLGLAAKHSEIKSYLNKNGITAVQPTLDPTPSPLPPDLDANSTQTKLITALQNKLRQRGFYAGARNGKFNQATIDAWNEYQLSQGWDADSVATTEEQVHLANDETTIAYNCDLKSGFTGVIVKHVEQRLAQLGYFTGTPNKGYDAQTVKAVKKYQKAMGITPANGNLLASQQKAFFDGTVIVPTPTPDPGLKIGDSGSAVKKLQNRLYTLGFYAGSINGKFNMATQSAVIAFQKAAGLSQTGMVNDECNTLILSSTEYVGTARTLSIGSKGIVVTAVEQKLALLGHFAGSPDTLYDKATYQAMKLYQAQAGLNQTGVANTQVLESLFAA
ncbi:MAG: peptidoglycan-binding protein [Clostridia bacterium]|nr:peptidoglycan-binding protein [Clostridia bacterium]